jgi:hypothetical protein
VARRSFQVFLCYYVTKVVGVFVRFFRCAFRLIEEETPNLSSQSQPTSYSNSIAVTVLESPEHFFEDEVIVEWKRAVCSLCFEVQ